MKEQVIELSTDPIEQNFARVVFFQRVQARGCKRLTRASWMTDVQSIDIVTEDDRATDAFVSDHVPERSFSVTRWTPKDSEVPVELAVDVGSGEISVWVGGPSELETARCLDEMRELFPRSAAGDDEIPMSFWYLTAHGPQRSSRRLSAPAWDEIKEHYSARTFTGISELMDPKFEPARGGQLLLWHGEPGTGKTFAIRALAREWASWCDFHLVTDPDRMFEHADYLMEVLLQGANEPTPPGEKRPRWRCLILEDSGEMLSADAKDRVGQGLSRLLNVVDGLIGQGLRILVLITTNEEMKTLHEAVSRPGRCASVIEFTELSTSEVIAWLERRGKLTQSFTHGRRIADLFGVVERWDNQSQKISVGFGR